MGGDPYGNNRDSIVDSQDIDLAECQAIKRAIDIGERANNRPGKRIIRRIKRLILHGPVHA